MAITLLGMVKWKTKIDIMIVKKTWKKSFKFITTWE